MRIGDLKTHWAIEVYMPLRMGRKRDLGFQRKIRQFTRR